MTKRALVFVFASVMLSACGYRGALTLPEQTPNTPVESQPTSDNEGE